MSLQPQDGGLRSAEPEAEATDPVDITCDLDATPNRTVRDLVRGMLTGRGDLVVEDAILVTDELVSNAHRHGETPRACRLGLRQRGRRLRVEVDDGSPNPPRKRTPDGTGGRGLVLIDQLAAAWGVQCHAHHKTVWAELVLDRVGGGRAAHLSVVPNRQS
ncbi:hypothetical protein GCM10009754_41510 [Amycolatopsis minnesotensis]|uniref:Histidine kinase/HSP90-like ATPase domain-containing protein n=2 Tax=Amycolatopsis minnesotensis TaxID=337894 RepID=A0ABP5CK27_9PSEU